MDKQVVTILFGIEKDVRKVYELPNGRGHALVHARDRRRGGLAGF